ncbi:MAG: [FeFe] hydrogenase H-cluster radical SAM maturase HydE [Clostridioides sp.]|jgi:biotin synthase|nr:[FeFe] hydrogenase H-cluster radical SAM maturase HydE [Clostridioides sp.]
MNNTKLKELIDKLDKTSNLNEEEFLYLIKNIFRTNNSDSNYTVNRKMLDYLCQKADAKRRLHYSNKVFLRGLIELTNYCKNDCYYCGIRASNKNIKRYRLNLDDIMECCKIGYSIGYRTFVLQGGEDPHFTDEVMCEIVSTIRKNYPDCAITLSIGERNYDSYKKLFNAGGDRFLLRHETATDEHYKLLHPESMKLEERIGCLKNMKEIGFQIGAGIMVESPYQTDENIVTDFIFLKNLNPHMVGVGPFIPHHDTKFKDFPAGNLDKTIFVLAVTRLLLPKCLLPATTALASISPNGRVRGLEAGCNVIMPNLSPQQLRKNYSLYDGKLSTGKESAEYHKDLEDSLKSIGLEIDSSRGDNIEWSRC